MLVLPGTSLLPAAAGVHGGLPGWDWPHRPKVVASSGLSGIGTTQAINTRYEDVKGPQMALRNAALGTRSALFGMVGDFLRGQSKPTVGACTLGLGSSCFGPKCRTFDIHISSGFYLTCALRLAKLASESAPDVYESANWVSAPGYQTESNQQYQHYGGFASPGAKSGAHQRQGRPRIRRTTNNNGGDEGEEEGGGPPRRRRPRPDPIDPNKPPKLYFACPFYKYDPLRHWRCYRKYEFKRPSDVTGHLERVHVIGDYYCANCFEEFDEEAQWCVHDWTACTTIRGPERLWKEDVDGLLRIQHGRGTDDSSKWYNLWDHVFPGVDRPDSPYVNEGFDEALEVVRAAGGESLRRALPGILRQNGFSVAGGNFRTLLRDMMNTLVPESTAAMTINSPYQRRIPPSLVSEASRSGPLQRYHRE